MVVIKKVALRRLFYIPKIIGIATVQVFSSRQKQSTYITALADFLMPLA